MMKIVRLLCAMFVFALTMAVQAESSAVSVNTFGIIRVESTTENTLIAVPWTWYSEKEEDALNILAKKLVRTYNLDDGDLLYSYLDNGTYRAWAVKTDETTKERYWMPVATATKGSAGTGTITVMNDEDESDKPTTWEPYLAAIADNDKVTKTARGNAVWLRRAHPTTSDGKAKPFWVYGQSVSTPVSNTIAAPTGDETFHTTLLGNPYAQAVKINDLKFSTTPDPMDRIFVPDGTLTPKTLMYVANKKAGKSQWRYSYTTTNSAGLPITSYSYDIEVKPGLAFWYDRRGSGEMTITWTPPTADTSSSDK